MAVDGTIGKKGTVELSQDCILGPEVAPAELLKEIVKIQPDKILTPLLNTRTSFCQKITPEKILRWQRREISQPLLRIDYEDGE